jgi:hypothetical protein
MQSLFWATAIGTILVLGLILVLEPRQHWPSTNPRAYFLADREACRVRAGLAREDRLASDPSPTAAQRLGVALCMAERGYTHPDLAP